MAERQYKVRMACDVRQRVQQTEWHLPTNRWWGRNPLQNFLYNQQLASTASLALCATNEVSSLPTKYLPTSQCWPFGEPTTSPTLCATKQEPTNNNISGSLCKQRSLKLAKQARQSARQRLHFILRRQTVGIPLKSLEFNGSSEPCERSVSSKLQHLQFLRCFFFMKNAIQVFFFYNFFFLQKGLK